MKKYSVQIFSWFVTMCSSLLLLWSPVCLALAVENPQSPPVIFTEILTGTKTSGTQEFIELYNTTDEPIDLTGWQVWYLSAQATNVDKPASSDVIMLGNGAESPIIGAHNYYVLSGRSDYLSGTARQFYTGTMAATGGNLRLLAPDTTQPCMLAVQDQLGWGNALYAQGAAANAPPTGQSLSRGRTADGAYADTQNNAADFTVTSNPSPAVINSNVISAGMEHNQTLLPKVAIESCVPPPSPIDTGTLLQQPSANDIPPSAPQSPQSSSGQAAQGATPFPTVDIGLVTPQITEVLPNPAAPKTDAHDEFIELYNSNTTAFDLSGFSLEVGTTTKHHYVFPAGTNLAPRSFTAFFSAITGLGMSNSGGQVRFIDPYGVVRNQSEPYGAAKEGQSWALIGTKWGWTLTPTPGSANAIGLPAATTQRSLTMANTTAKKASSVKNSAAKTAAAKTKSSKQSKTKTNVVTQPKTTAMATPLRSLHPTVLAVIAGFAILYGLYEYRQDLANKFYQYRSNRATRRIHRAEAEGG